VRKSRSIWTTLLSEFLSLMVNGVAQRPIEGVLITDGGRFVGYAFYLLKSRPVFTWNLLGLERIKWQDKKALAPGKHTLEYDWKYDGPGLGTGGNLQRRRRYWHAGGRQGLPGAVPLYRQDQQAHGESRAGRAVSRRAAQDRQDVPGQAVGAQPPWKWSPNGNEQEGRMRG
jgi:hypothetical protein